MTGEPSHLELGVGDVDAARVFYGALLKWDLPGLTGAAQANTATLPIGLHGGDPHNHFEVFFNVDDLGESLDRVRELGGTVVGEIHDEPHFGRWVECTDDQGVRFGLRELS